MEKQMAYVRTACELETFESLERKMRGKGEQLMAEYRNQYKTIEQNEKDDDMGHNALDLVRLQKQQYHNNRSRGTAPARDH
jgi:hypothetical protein